MTPTDGRPRVGLDTALREATGILARAGVATPRFDALELAAHALAVGRGEVERRAVLGAPAPSGLAGLVAERARRVPLQHLTGKTGFRRIELTVGPGVFVPRPETELLVGLALAELADRAVTAPDPLVVDLCTGSGAIAFAVADECARARVAAVDLDEGALAWACRNRDLLGLDVELRVGDAGHAFPELDGCVDVVTCNPPYIPAGAVPRDAEVRDHDPPLALYGGGACGLRTPRRMIAAAGRLLRPGGLLLLEHADVQGDTLAGELARQPAWTHVRDHRDLAGRPRVLVARRLAPGSDPRQDGASVTVGGSTRPGGGEPVGTDREDAAPSGCEGEVDVA